MNDIPVKLLLKQQSLQSMGVFSCCLGQEYTWYLLKHAWMTPTFQSNLDTHNWHIYGKCKVLNVSMLFLNQIQKKANNCKSEFFSWSKVLSFKERPYFFTCTIFESYIHRLKVRRSNIKRDKKATVNCRFSNILQRLTVPWIINQFWRKMCKKKGKDVDYKLL